MMKIRTLLLVVVTLAASLNIVRPATAAAASKIHCGANVVGTTATGEAILGAQACFATEQEVEVWLQTTSPANGDLGILAVTTFYNPPAFSGTSFSVGYSCGGGYLNFTNFSYPGGGTWNDKVSAVITSCSYVSLYFNINLGGSRYQVNGSAILTGTGMDNAASSAGIQYA